MALANEDLQAIAHLLDLKIGSALQPITEEIREVKEDLRGVKEEIREMKEDLEGVKEDLRGVKEEVRDLREDMENVKEDLIGVKEDLKGVKEEVRKINFHLENVTDRNISLLVENYVPAANRFESAAEEIRAIQSDQYIMKKMITKHSEMFQKISLAAT